MMVYKIKDRFGVVNNADQLDAAAVAGSLENIRERNGGKLEPPAIVKTARSKRSALHPAFEWDDKAAAHLHRLQQARSLVKSVVVVSEREDGKEHESPAYYSVRLAPTDRPYYQSATVIRESDAERDAAIDALHRQIVALAKALDELKHMTDEPWVDAAQEAFDAFRETTRQEAA